MVIKVVSEVGSLLKILPPVEFCCIYGSSLHPNNDDKSTMEDYILGVSDPQQWHHENLKMNRGHYASWIMPLGGARLVTKVADKVGVGVHFNPFVSWNDKMYKYGVIRSDDLIHDIVDWEKLYFSGRLQKPVNVLVDNLGIRKTNMVNLKAASSAALLLLPIKFTEIELYAKICSLSYMGDLRMLFAEDKNKVAKIVQGQLNLFKAMYQPLLEEYATKDLLRFSSGDNISQDCSLSSTSSLISSLPTSIRNQMGKRLGDDKIANQTGQVINEIAIRSRAEAAECMQKVLRRRVMLSSVRQAAAGLLTAGAVQGVRYLAKKMNKAWKSWI